MATNSFKSSKILLITGDPGKKKKNYYLNLYKIILNEKHLGSGKSTLIKKLAKQIRSQGLKEVRGFYTQEIRDEKHVRIGFELIDINDENNRAPLARVR